MAELEDPARVFEGETAEHFYVLQHAVRTGRVRLADAQAAMAGAMQTIKHALERKGERRGRD